MERTPEVLHLRRWDHKSTKSIQYSGARRNERERGRGREMRSNKELQFDNAVRRKLVFAHIDRD